MSQLRHRPCHIRTSHRWNEKLSALKALGFEFSCSDKPSCSTELDLSESEVSIKLHYTIYHPGKHPCVRLSILSSSVLITAKQLEDSVLLVSDQDEIVGNLLQLMLKWKQDEALQALFNATNYSKQLQQPTPLAAVADPMAIDSSPSIVVTSAPDVPASTTSAAPFLDVNSILLLHQGKLPTEVTLPDPTIHQPIPNDDNGTLHAVEDVVDLGESSSVEVFLAETDELVDHSKLGSEAPHVVPEEDELGKFRKLWEFDLVFCSFSILQLEVTNGFLSLFSVKSGITVRNLCNTCLTSSLPRFCQ